MYKVIWLVRFHEGMPRDEAVRHWREVHGPLGVKVPGMKRYVQNHWISDSRITVRPKVMSSEENSVTRK